MNNKSLACILLAACLLSSQTLAQGRAPAEPAARTPPADPAPQPRREPPKAKPTPKRKPPPPARPTPQPTPQPAPQPTPPQTEPNGGVKAEYEVKSVWPGELRFNLGTRQFKKLPGGDQTPLNRTRVGIGVGGNWNKMRWFGLGFMFEWDFWGQELRGVPVDEDLRTGSFAGNAQAWVKFWRLRPEVSAGLGWLQTGKKVFPGDLKTKEEGKGGKSTEEPEFTEKVVYTTVRYAVGFQPMSGSQLEFRPFFERYFIDRKFEEVSGYDRNVIGYGLSIGWMGAWDKKKHGVVHESYKVTPTK